MLCSKILVAYDHSDLAQRSLKKALEIAQTDPAIEVHVVHAVVVPEIARSVLEFSALVDAIFQEGKDILTKAESSLSRLPNPSQTYLLEGKSPAQVILQHAQKHNCDLIVLGSRGLSGIKEFLGSVSHKIVQQAKITVLIIK